jgi:hypothetical protein
MTGTGNILIGGLPFTVSSSAPWGSVSAYANNLTFTGQLSALVRASTTTVGIYSFASGVAGAGVPVDTAATVELTGFYFL